MKRNEGALTVEACISLTIFLMIFMTILFIMRIVFAYGLIQHALVQTAKEFSGYSYYYTASGLADINGTINSSTQGGVSSFNDNVSNVVNVYEKFSDLGNGFKDMVNNTKSGNINSVLSSLNGLSDQYSDFQNAMGPASDTVRAIADDPVGAIKSVGSVLLSGGNDAAKSFICGEISKALMAKYISEGGYAGANDRLSKLRVVGGISGLDFSSSSFWSTGNANDIEFVVCYTIDPIFPFKIIDEVNMINRVKVCGWSGKSIF